MPRVVSVGRLDLNTEGLLLLTNDGGLARALELPATGWLRRYRVRAYGKVTQARLDGLRDGIEVDGVRYGAIEATLDREQGSNVWLTFAMREGKNREIRNVLRRARPEGEPADPRVLRAVPARRTAGRRGRGGQDAARCASRSASGSRRWRARIFPGRSWSGRSPSRKPISPRHPEVRAQRASKGDGPDRELRRDGHDLAVSSRRAKAGGRRPADVPRRASGTAGRHLEATPSAAHLRMTGRRQRAARRDAASRNRAGRITRKRAALMRIVGGRFRGRTLMRRNRRRSGRPPTGCARRCSTSSRTPTAIRSRGARVLDLFAGTGALGLEALSRGAAFVLFVDDGAEARALLRGNVDALGRGRRDQGLSPRRHAARSGASAGAVLAGVPRSALRQGPGGAGARRPRATAAGLRPMRWSSSRRRRMRASPRRRASRRSSGATTARRRLVSCALR